MRIGNRGVGSSLSSRQVETERCGGRGARYKSIAQTDDWLRKLKDWLSVTKHPFGKPREAREYGGGDSEEVDGLNPPPRLIRRLSY